jgi:hypothetical protein
MLKSTTLNLARPTGVVRQSFSRSAAKAPAKTEPERELEIGQTNAVWGRAGHRRAKHKAWEFQGIL